MVSLVTALFDINREKVDGRRLDDYLTWFEKTLQINCNMFIYTEAKFVDFIQLKRPKCLLKHNTVIGIIDLQDIYYYKYYDKIYDILNNEEYKSKITDPKRIECILPEYNIIQYSKFDFLKKSIMNNYFKSDFFFWIDAGISRFFFDLNILNRYPTKNSLDFIKKSKFIIQKRQDLEVYNIDETLLWKSENLLKGTMFGGSGNYINIISDKIEQVFVNEMLANNVVNNEQIALAQVWKSNKDIFTIVDDNPTCHLQLFRLFGSNSVVDYNLILIKPHGCGTESVRRSLLKFAKNYKLKVFDYDLHVDEQHGRSYEIFNSKHDNCYYDISSWHTFYDVRFIKRHDIIMNKNKKNLYITCIREPFERAISRYYLNFHLFAKEMLSFDEFYTKYGGVNNESFDIKDNYISNYLGFHDSREITIETVKERYPIIFELSTVQTTSAFLKQKYNINLDYERFESNTSSFKYKFTNHNKVCEKTMNMFKNNNEMDYKLYKICKQIISDYE